MISRYKEGDNIIDYIKANCFVESPLSIRSARELAELTVNETTEIFEIPVSTFRKWEQGASNPPEWARKLIVSKLFEINKIKKSIQK